MTKRFVPLSTLVSVLALTLGVAGAGHAQPQPSGPAQQPPAATQRPDLGDGSDIPDQELRKFAQAQSQVEEIKNEYRGEIQKHAQDADKAMEVQREAQQEMVEAVEDSGLDVRKYNQIAQLSQYDSRFRARIEAQR